MISELAFKAFVRDNKDACLTLFDENCPKHFAPNERMSYETFLDKEPEGYEICLSGTSVVGAYGLIENDADTRRLNWIIVSAKTQRLGFGDAIMRRVINRARSLGVTRVNISASHLSAPFFLRHGAVSLAEEVDGWGPGMHRIDMLLSF